MQQQEELTEELFEQSTVDSPADTEQTTPEKPDTLIKKLDVLNTAYYKRFCQLKENFALLPVEQYKAMSAALTKQYERDYKLLDGADGIDVDKQIEELEKTRIEQLEQLKLQRDRIAEELTTERENAIKGLEQEREKQLEELELEHTKALKELRLERERVLAEIEAQKFKQSQELELQKEVAKAENDVKRETVVPRDLPKRWWQLYARPNYGKQLVQEVAEIEIENYYDKRESELAKLENAAGSYIGELLNALPAPRRRRARQKWQSEITKLERKLLLLLPSTPAEQSEGQTAEHTSSEKRRIRKAAKAQLKQAERAADGKTVDETVNEQPTPAAEPQEHDTTD